MKHLVRQLLVVALVAGGIWVWNSAPRTAEVETGRSTQYPDLKVRDYGAGSDEVVKAAKATLNKLPGWTLVGEGKGVAGAELQAVHQTRLVPLKHDVTIRIRREKGRTLVSVRGKAREARLDFGQNARNIREFLDALDHAVF